MTTFGRICQHLNLCSPEELSQIIGVSQELLLKILRQQKEILQIVEEEPSVEEDTLVREKTKPSVEEVTLVREKAIVTIFPSKPQKPILQKKLKKKAAKGAKKDGFIGRQPRRRTLADFFDDGDEEVKEFLGPSPSKLDKTCVVLKGSKSISRDDLMRDLAIIFKSDRKKLVKRIFFVEKNRQFTGTIFIYCFSASHGYKVKKFFETKGTTVSFRKE